MKAIKTIGASIITAFIIGSVAHVASAQQGPMHGNTAKTMTEVPMPTKVEDTRQAVQLTEAERTIVVADMRQMLASIQAIADGVANGNMQAVAKAASKSGESMMAELPTQIRMKFPESFAQMGLASHKAFDRIALEAQTGKNQAAVLKQLAAGIQNCVACHATYRLK